jgi:ABC-type lipoprotein export system ATPase subunit
MPQVTIDEKSLTSMERDIDRYLNDINYKPNSVQKGVAIAAKLMFSRGKKLFIDAPPGCGKSRILAAIVVLLLISKNGKKIPTSV